MFVLSTQITSVPHIAQSVDALQIEPFIEGTEIPSIMCLQWQQDDECFGDGVRYFFHLPGTSTRGIEVWRDENDMRICILPFTEPNEFEIALQFLESFQQFGATVIRSDLDDEIVGFDFLRYKFSHEFNAHFGRAAMRSMMSAVEGTDDHYSLHGPIGRFTFGPYLASCFAAVTDEGERLQWLQNMMRLQQFWPLMEDYQQLQEPRYEKQRNKTFAYIEPDVSYAVLEATHLRFCLSDGAYSDISRADFYERYGRTLTFDKFCPFDEVQFMLRLNASEIQTFGAEKVSKFLIRSLFGALK